MSLEVYPQLRVTPDNDVAEQARRALGVGATGVFLYPHREVGEERLMDALEQTRSALLSETKDPFVGVMASSNQAPRILHGAVVRAVQIGLLSAAPSALFVPYAQESALFAKSFRTQHAELLKNTRYFGGFEYPGSVAPKEESIRFNASLVVDLVDVVASRVDSLNPFEAARKAQVVKESVGTKRHAAYGRISPANIDNLAPYVDALLLGFGIEMGSGDICFSTLKSQIILAKTAA